MANEIPQPPNTLLSTAQTISQLAPLFLGTGRTNTSGGTTTSASPSQLAFNQQLEEEANNNANNPSITDSVVQNIMNQAAIAFAPIVGQQNSAGMYNTSTLQMLAGQASGAATAQASQAVLNFKTSQQQIAAQSNQAGLNATKTTTTGETAKTGPVINVGGGGTLGTLAAAGSAGMSIAKFLFPEQTKNISGSLINGVKSAGSSLKDLMFGNGADAAGTPAAEAVGGDAGAAGLVPSSFSDVGSNVGGTLSDAPASTLSSIDPSSFMVADSGNFASDAASSLFSDTAPEVASSTAAQTVASTFSDSGALADSGLADPFASEAGADAGATAAASAAGTVVGDTGGEAAAELGTSAFATDTGGLGADLLSSSAGEIAGETAGDVTSAFATDVGSSVASEAAAEAGGQVAGDVSGAIAGEVAGDVASAALGTATGIAGVGGAIHLAGTLIGGDGGTALQAVGDLLDPMTGIADVGAAIGTAIGGTAGQAIEVVTDPIGAIADAVSVICTVMKDQGTLHKGSYNRSSVIFRGYNDASRKSYWLWAKPAARFIALHPQHPVSKALQSLFRARTDHVIGNKTVYGFFARYLIAAFTTTLGVVTGVAPREWFKMFIAKVA